MTSADDIRKLIAAADRERQVAKGAREVKTSIWQERGVKVRRDSGGLLSFLRPPRRNEKPAFTWTFDYDASEAIRRALDIVEREAIEKADQYEKAVTSGR